MHDLCRKCGSNDHFIGQCTRDHLDEWVDKFGGELRLHSKVCKTCKKDIEYLPNHHRFCEGCLNVLNICIFWSSINFTLSSFSKKNYTYMKKNHVYPKDI